MKRRVTRKELMRRIRGLLLGNDKDTSHFMFKRGYECALEDISHHFGEAVQRKEKK